MRERIPGACRLLLLACLAAALAAGCADEDGDGDHFGPTGEPLELTSFKLRIAEVGDRWIATIRPTGGTTPYSYYIAAGTLPPGIAYESDPLDVTVLGEPALAGNYPFTVDVTDADSAVVTADFVLRVVDLVDISGTWLYTMTVTMVNGDCGEVVGASRTHTLTIAQTGRDLVFSGFFDNPDAQLTGSVVLTEPDAVVSGSYPEGPGITEGEHALYIYSLWEMEGTEHWSWTGEGGTCTHSRAHITAQRIGP